MESNSRNRGWWPRIRFEVGYEGEGSGGRWWSRTGDQYVRRV